MASATPPGLQSGGRSRSKNPLADAAAEHPCRASQFDIGSDAESDASSFQQAAPVSATGPAYAADTSADGYWDDCGSCWVSSSKGSGNERGYYQSWGVKLHNALASQY